MKITTKGEENKFSPFTIELHFQNAEDVLTWQEQLAHEPLLYADVKNTTTNIEYYLIIDQITQAIKKQMGE